MDLGVIILTQIFCLLDQAGLRVRGWGTGRSEKMVMEEEEEDTVHRSSHVSKAMNKMIMVSGTGFSINPSFLTIPELGCPGQA